MLGDITRNTVKVYFHTDAVNFRFWFYSLLDACVSGHVL